MTVCVQPLCENRMLICANGCHAGTVSVSEIPPRSFLLTTVVREGPRTRDMGGKASTSEMGKAIAEALR